MTLSQIKQELKKGNKVYWHNENYEVIYNKHGEYLIKCSNGYITALFNNDGKLNENGNDFYSVNKKHLID